MASDCQKTAHSISHPIDVSLPNLLHFISKSRITIPVDALLNEIREEQNT